MSFIRNAIQGIANCVSNNREPIETCCVISCGLAAVTAPVAVSYHYATRIVAGFISMISPCCAPETATTAALVIGCGTPETVRDKCCMCIACCCCLPPIVVGRSIGTSAASMIDNAARAVAGQPPRVVRDQPQPFIPAQGPGFIPAQGHRPRNNNNNDEGIDAP